MSGVAFTNSAAAPSATQQLTFVATGATLTNGLFTLTTALGATTGPIVFDADPTNGATITAEDIQAALPGATVTVDPTSTATAFVFDVTYATAQPVLLLGTVTNVLPSTAYAATIVTAWSNADLLAYFNPYLGFSVGVGSTYSATIYNALLSTANENVDSAIDQVLYAAQYTPPPSVPTASQDQLGRLRSVLGTVVGDLRGESAGVLLSQWDADPEDSQNATFADSVVSTQRSGQDQRFYLVVPADVQGGSFQIRFTVPGQPNLYTTATITMPSTTANYPGGPINTANRPEHRQRHQRHPGQYLADRSCARVRLRERADGAGIGNRRPQRVGVRRPRQRHYGRIAHGAASGKHVPLVQRNPRRHRVHRRRFRVDLPRTGPRSVDPEHVDRQQQHHAMGAGDYREQRHKHHNVYANRRESGAGLCRRLPGTAGPVSYGQSLAMTSSGSFDEAYTYEPVNLGNVNSISTSTSATGQAAAGSSPVLSEVTSSNVYVQQLAESTATAGPRVVGVSDSNGINLLNPPGGTATSVNSRYFVLTFDEPMLNLSPSVNADSVYNVNNYQIYNDAGNLIAGAVAQVHYGVSEVAAMAQTYGAQFSSNPRRRPFQTTSGRSFSRSATTARRCPAAPTP